MQYMYVKWLHNSPEYPISIYAEIDDERFETRKVDIYPNGRIDYFDDKNAEGLGVVPVPAFEVIMEEKEFLVEEINKDEFEKIWSGKLLR